MRIVFFDIDGTLIDGKQNMPTSVAQSIEKLRQSGHIPILSTGRPLCTIPPFVTSLGFLGVIGACGTSVRLLGKTILEETLPNAYLKELIYCLEYNQVNPLLEGAEAVYVADLSNNKYEEDRMKYLSWGCDIFRSWKSDSVRVNKLTYLLDVAGDFKPVRQLLEQEFIQIEYNEVLGDWIRKGFSKATAIERVVGILGGSLKDAVAFGDSKNDIEMLQLVGCGVAMGNASEETKQVADYIAKPIWEDGIACALSELGLLSSVGK